MSTGRRARCLLALAALLVACDGLPTIEDGVCGNRVVDPDEDCDTFGAGKGTFCRPPGSPGQCRFACGPQPNGTTPVCPAGMGCGADGTCRTPDGSFAEATEPVAGDFGEILVGDVDGDGRADVLAVSQSDFVVSYFDATATLEATFQTARAGVSLANPLLGDLSGDVHADVLVAINGGTLVDLGSANRTLEPTACPSAVVQGYTNVRLIPLKALPDQPGDQVIAMGTFAGVSAIAVLQTTGQAGFIQALPQPPSALAGDVVVGRLDEDSVLSPCDQFAFAFDGGGEVDVYTSCKPDGMGGFAWNTGATATAIVLSEGATVARGPLLLDMNGDGHLDFVIGASTCSGAGCEQVQVAFGVGDGTFHSDPQTIPKSGGDNRFSVYPLLSGALPIAMGDLNGDGVPDLVSPRAVRVSAIDAAGNVSFDTAAVPSSGSWTEAIIADLNHDGIPDVLAGSSASANLDFFSGHGDGTLAPFHIPTRGPVSHLTLGDFDGDLVNDVALREAGVSADAPGDSVSVLFGNPVGAPDPPISMGLFVGLEQVARARLPANGLGGQFVYGVDDLLTISVPGAGKTYFADFAGSGDRVLRSPWFMAGASGKALWGGRPLHYALGSFTASHGPAQVAAIDYQYTGSPNPPIHRLWLSPTDGNGQLLTQSTAPSDPLPPDLDWQYAAIGAVDLDGNGVDSLVALGPADHSSSQGALAIARAVPVTVQGVQYNQLQISMSTHVDAYVHRDETSAPVSQTGRLVVADMDGDGRSDVVVVAKVVEPGAPPGTAATPHAVVLWNDHQGTLGAMTVVPNPSTNTAPHAAADIALLGPGYDAAHAPMPPGHGGGGPPASPPSVALLTDEGVFVVRFTGRDPVVPQAPAVPVTGGRRVASGDVDGDGVPDLVVADGDGFVVHRGEAVRP